MMANPNFQSTDPVIGTSNTGDPGSFAYSTARERWVKILDTTIGDVRLRREKSGFSEEDIAAAVVIESQLASLKSSIMSNAVLSLVLQDGGSDVGDYNKELETLGESRWLHSPWLYTECYMYRVIYTFFSRSTPFWQSYDVFADSKRHSLVGSKKGAIELVKRFRGILQAKEKDQVDEATQKTIFEEMVQICLWGNATDLSLLTSLSVEELDSRQGRAAREASKVNILADHTEHVWGLLSKLKSSGSTGEIHIVVDNAGFELLTDLVFVGYLIEGGYAKKIVLHGKRLPWFVSDVMKDDLRYLVQGFSQGTVYEGIDPNDGKEARTAGRYWQELLDSSSIEFRDETFWTTQHPFGRMPVLDPQLFNDLSEADLVIYKGDLNYRKLTYDGLWPHDTSFTKAIGPLGTKHNGKGVRTLVLRTCKADVCVGLKPGQDQNLEQGWTRTGKYAVVSYCDAKS